MRRAAVLALALFVGDLCAAELPPLSEAAHAALTEAERLRKGGDAAGAEAALRRLLDGGTREPHEVALAHQILAHVALDQGREADAATSLGAALTTGALPAEVARGARYTRAQLLLGLGDPAGASSELEAWFAATPAPEATAHALRASVLARLDRPGEAAASMARAVAGRDPPPEDWLAFWTGLLAEAGDREAALEVARQRVRLFLDSRAGWEAWAGLHADADRRAEALAVLELGAAQGAVATVEDHQRLAGLRLELGLAFEAAFELERALAKHGDSPVLRSLAEEARARAGLAP